MYVCMYVRISSYLTPLNRFVNLSILNDLATEAGSSLALTECDLRLPDTPEVSGERNYGSGFRV